MSTCEAGSGPATRSDRGSSVEGCQLPCVPARAAGTTSPDNTATCDDASHARPAPGIVRGTTGFWPRGTRAPPRTSAPVRRSSAAAAVRRADFRLVATSRILRPAFGKKQPEVRQTHPFASGQTGKYADLAVLDFPCATGPLAMHPDRRIAFLEKAGLVENQRGLPHIAKDAVGLADELVHESFVRPGRGVDELLHALLDEVRGIAVAKLHEAPCHSAQGAGVIFFILRSPAAASAVGLRSSVGNQPSRQPLTIPRNRVKIFNQVELESDACPPST